VTDHTRVAARSADTRLVAACTQYASGDAALAEAYAPGREPGGYARWRDDGGRARHELHAARERARMARALWCRVHPERPECQPIMLTNYRAPEPVPRAAVGPPGPRRSQTESTPAGEKGRGTPSGVPGPRRSGRPETLG